MDILWNKNEIIKVLNNKYVCVGNGKVFEISTTGFPLTKKICRKGRKKKGEFSFSNWANDTIKTITNGEKDKSNLDTPIHFAYIKFVENKDGDILGIIGGKSQFHSGYNSDINYTDYEEHLSAGNYIKNNELKIYTQDVIIVLNNEPNKTNADNDEKWIIKEFNLFSSQKLE